MSRALPGDGQSPEETEAAAAQAASAVVRLFLVMRAVVVMPVDVTRHMMAGMVMALMMAMVRGGRGRRGEHQRGRNDDRQSRDDFTHERLHE